MRNGSTGSFTMKGGDLREVQAGEPRCRLPTRDVVEGADRQLQSLTDKERLHSHLLMSPGMVDALHKDDSSRSLHSPASSSCPAP
jgi:hypothetical protein